MNRFWRRAQWVLAPLVLLLAGYALWHQMAALSTTRLQAAWRATPAVHIAWSLACTAVSFACLSAYEWIAVQCAVPGRIPARMALHVGVLSHAIANTLGFHALTGSAFRYQQYRQCGLGLGDIARVVAVVAICVGTGVALVAALAFTWLQFQQARPALGLLSGCATIVTLALLLPAVLRRAQLGLPKLASTIGLPLLAMIEMVAAIGALVALLPPGTLPGIPQFVLVFVGAMLLGIVSHSPGGLGVFEAAVLSALPAADAAGVLVALLLYRATYNLLPFTLAFIALAARWARGRQAQLDGG